MSDDRLDEIKAALAAGDADEWWPLDASGGIDHLTGAQFEFYSDAPNTTAFLIAEVERLREEVALWRATGIDPRLGIRPISWPAAAAATRAALEVAALSSDINASSAARHALQATAAAALQEPQ